MTFTTGKYAVRSARIAEEERNRDANNTQVASVGDRLRQRVDPQGVLRGVTPVNLSGGASADPFTVNPTSSTMEARLRKARKRVVKMIADDAVPPAVALIAAHKRYVKKGGRLDFRSFCRAIER